MSNKKTQAEPVGLASLVNRAPISAASIEKSDSVFCLSGWISDFLIQTDTT
jgi:hypothetical protein